MPLIEVHLCAGRTDDEKKELLFAITEAVHKAIGAPIGSIRVWVNEIRATEIMAAGVLLSDRSKDSDHH